MGLLLQSQYESFRLLLVTIYILQNVHVQLFYICHIFTAPLCNRHRPQWSMAPLFGKPRCKDFYNLALSTSVTDVSCVYLNSSLL